MLHTSTTLSLTETLTTTFLLSFNRGLTDSTTADLKAASLLLAQGELTLEGSEGPGLQALVNRAP
jgi:hypothetical protein